jgi:hypothetical protein
MRSAGGCATCKENPMQLSRMLTLKLLKRHDWTRRAPVQAPRRRSALSSLRQRRSSSLSRA